MAYKLKTKLANRKNYGSSRSVSKIKYIVIHYTANDGDTDENNGKYFANNVVKASAHYFVDDDSVTQTVPDNYVAWAVGGSRYSNYKVTGGAKLYGIANNTNSLSIELCDDVKNGVIYPSEATINNAIELVKHLQNKYSIPDENVIRHFDVNGKKCPVYWVDDAKWEAEFKSKLVDRLEVDGHWGRGTTLKTQKVFGTIQDGEISHQPKTYKINLSRCQTSSWEFDDTRKGSQLIRTIQTFLKDLGFYDGKIDGLCEKKTVMAIQKFLASLGLYDGKIDGKMGKGTVSGWQMYINSRL